MIKKTLIRHLVIDCRVELIRVIMDQANQIGLVSEYFSFMFTSLVRISRRFVVTSMFPSSLHLDDETVYVNRNKGLDWVR